MLALSGKRIKVISPSQTAVKYTLGNFPLVARIEEPIVHWLDNTLISRLAEMYS